MALFILGHALRKQPPDTSTALLCVCERGDFVPSLPQCPVPLFPAGSARPPGPPRSCRSHWRKGNESFCGVSPWGLEAGSLSVFPFTKHGCWLVHVRYLPSTRCPPSHSSAVSAAVSDNNHLPSALQGEPGPRGLVGPPGSRGNPVSDRVLWSQHHLEQ